MSKTSQSSITQMLFEGTVDVIAVSCYANERPLQGLAGELDWQVRGQISHYLRQGALNGQEGEMTYLPIRFKDKSLNVIFYGMGFNHYPRERTLPHPQTLKKIEDNLVRLKFKKIGFSKKDLGIEEISEIESYFQEVTLCLAP